MVEMKDPERIATRQETIDKAFDAFKQAIENIEKAETAYRSGEDSLCRAYLQDTEHTIGEIRVFVGGTNR